MLDVSCNFLEMLPHSFSGNVKLREFYFEENPFLPHIPIPSEQQLEVLPLRVSSCVAYKQCHCCKVLIVLVIKLNRINSQNVTFYFSVH